MPKPISAADPTPVRVVIVTMDSHLAGAVERARSALRTELPGLDLAIHAADEWGNDEAALDRCHAAIAQGDIIVATMLFLEDHIRAVQPALAARREACDAMVCAMSAGEIMQLTRLGKFSMAAGQSSGAMGLLKRLRGAKSRAGGSSGQGQMKMLQQLPRLLRFIPGTAQDVRNYFLVLQYWLAGSDQNLTSLVRLMVTRYASGPRRHIAGTLRAAPPVVYPDIGLYHPGPCDTGACGVKACGTGACAAQTCRAGACRTEGRNRIFERIEHLPTGGQVPGSAGTVGLLVMRSYLLGGNTSHYDGVIAALEAKGLRVIPAFASGLDARPAIERYFLRNGVATIDALVSLTGFSLVGGPAYNDASAAADMLARLDIPYLAAHPVEFQTIEQWQADARGLTPVEATMMVAIPELDGATSPMTFGGRSSARAGTASRNMVCLPERTTTLAARVARLVKLRRTPRPERKLAVVLFCFPPNAGTVGTAAYLGVYASLHRVLLAAKAAGYRLDVPATPDMLRERILGGNAERYGTYANVARRIPTDDHVRREPHLAEIERQWGPAPGRQQSDGSSLFVLGVEFGNVFVGVQPAFGVEGDPMRLLFEKDFAPTHAFSAFYRYLREDFGAHAVLHFGTHGALEFMPGKQAGLSGACWPDRLIGDLPNVYLYASNNPSEGALAKRRAGATLVSYLTPPVTHAGLYRGLADLKASLDRLRSLDPVAEAEQYRAMLGLVQAQAATVELAAAEPAWEGDAAADVDGLRAALLDLEYTLIPHGFHVVGEPPSAEARAAMLDAAGIEDPDRRALADRLLAEDHEIPALIHALDGGYTRPAPGGDLLRTIEVLPTGRNLHGFDPFRLPSAFAVKDGARQADRLLARHATEGHGLPETVAMVLWGTDNLKTEGGPLSQALWLMGAEPRRDSYGRLVGARLVPLATLGRPRIDVVITLSGIFRDLLPLQTKLLAEAALLAASAEEAPEQNFLRKHALAFLLAKGGDSTKPEDIAQAALRVFGNADGAYGANVNQLVDSGGWNDEDELAEAYVRRKGFAYGVDGRPARQEAVLAHILKSVAVTYQNLDSIELGVTTVDHYFDTLGGISRAVRRARGAPAQVYIGDQTRGDGTVRTLSEQVSLETRTRALNPKWYEALLEHGYEGVRQIEAHVTNTLGWSATTGQVSPWIYQQLAETYVLDPEMRDRLAALNATTSAKLANRLLEAHDRNYWSPDAATLEALRRAGEELEDRLEGIVSERVAA
jgi:magnesium chelatase subunit H